MENKLNIKEYLDKDEQKDLLRLLTAGSVDDGKSTLIGRLLFDSKKLYEDQLAALERDSKRVGNAGDHIDYALLCDGLKAEREQGITIDVAYRYFSTNNRKFIIADTPGHEQYTRNMITGGSTANLAIILVDARLGVITQTCRHTFLVSLLGIKHVVLAVNNDGKTNEATKNLREPLQKGQTNPKDARQQQQQEKPQKKTGKGTFLNFLKAIYQNNVTFNTNEDFRSQRKRVLFSFLSL